MGEQNFYQQGAERIRKLRRMSTKAMERLQGQNKVWMIQFKAFKKIKKVEVEMKTLELIKMRKKGIIRSMKGL